ncbi:zinc finger protein-like protein OZF [Dendryphion nanum]|uniref:Zinc finger protein-like protein OZF n=1 Tax=Dendryphion nanum TaxID=256645 RepID=A0A9P9DNQ2_9PLEO|nr:zinc finger protein-like protein OZF [Dendryphion nanum]
MAAVVASHHAGLWPRRPDQAIHIPNMHMSGMMHPYDSTARTVTTSPASRSFQPTSSHMDMNMPLFSTHNLTTSVPYQSGAGAFAFDSLAVNPYNMQQQFPVSYNAPLSHSVSYPPASSIQPMPTVREARNPFHMERSSPPVKVETSSPVQPSQIYHDSGFGGEDFKPVKIDSGENSGIDFSTDVDTLMKEIQAKEKLKQSQPRAAPVPKVEPVKTAQKPKKKYICTMDGCEKSFYQKTHLDIHTRSHTGHKPFLCKEPTCGQRFSQMGNLKTHERRHTGERPYSCDICGKTFAQRGNVRAHKIVHKNEKPFICKLDDCGKSFTQLGNLKSHQNKFHANTIRYLTNKFKTVQQGQSVSMHDKELWEYFADLYKNSNKGIKGRGKDRRIPVTGLSTSATSSSSSYSPTTATSLNRHYPGSYHHAHGDRGSPCSSLSSDHTVKPNEAFDFNSPLQTGYQTQSGYDDTVFPERRLF